MNTKKIKMIKKCRETVYHGCIENKKKTPEMEYDYKDFIKDLYECVILGHTILERR